MFIHLLAGSLVFLWLGSVFDVEISNTYLLFGAFCGLVTDLISFMIVGSIKYNKWAHTHRDNFSHSILFPIALLILSIYLDSEIRIMMSVAMLTHPLLDLYGIGWGVKLFYPLSNKTYKVFYKGRIMVIWDQKKVDAEAEKNGDDDWIRNIYFKFNIIGVIEWLSLAGFLILLVMN